MEDVKDTLKGHMLEHKCSKLRSSRRLDDQPDHEGANCNATSWMERTQHSLLSSKAAAQSCSKPCNSMQGASAQHATTKWDKLEPNSSKELQSACPFYMGEETSIAHYPVTSSAFRHKKFNPIIDILDQRIQ